ncbi:hypothetical protein PQJ75_08680 [Rhodoplanes sp. TEM]|uniref:Uncharacterized protein n=1 Tax=Rhodoplanes tepidamans TaxID=200616 RepID=A0ABT5J8S2_RHOTP|nr:MULTISPECIES: hypothetical protein [Rhodoplanes]MDC7786058.1 hypothetical protein [Rhodoplanes tepidamans]MDC7983801.1 hypothetical protein [Rhodoplanes sp. TEM]MDQ0354901.1 hypothetical protein [Rhodoplanes tepidamans]
MTYTITGHDTAGALTLKRETPAATIKKAGELLAEGVTEIEITDPDGSRYTAAEFAARHAERV